MANRYVAFGYEITDGQIMVIETEKNIVENIFGMYINGQSLLEIANRMNASGAAYNNDGRNWNKNIIKRILENRKYLGEDEYPQIIADDTFNKASKVRDKKAPTVNERRKELNTIFHDYLVCAGCGQRLDRYKGSKKQGSYRRCKNPECNSPATAINDRDLETVIKDILNSIIRNPECIKADENRTGQDEKCQMNIDEIMDERKMDMKDIVAKILDDAEIRFEKSTEQDYTAIDEKIRTELSIRAERENIDIPLLKSIMKQMRLHPGKMIEMELINGNRFTGGIHDDRRSISGHRNTTGN